MVRPMLGHLDPEFIALLEETNDRLITVFGTENGHQSPDVIAVGHAETPTGVRTDVAELGANEGDAL